MGETDQHAHATATEFGHVCVPGQGAIEHDAEVLRLRARLQLCVTECCVHSYRCFNILFQLKISFA